jgi:hypothetical protein
VKNQNIKMDKDRAQLIVSNRLILLSNTYQDVQNLVVARSIEIIDWVEILNIHKIREKGYK